MTLLNLSFAACGFMGMYHLGAAGALLRHGDRLLGSLRACAGASAGALVAAAMVTAPDKLEVCKDFTLRFAESVRRRRFGAVTPGYDFMLELREGVEEVLPADAHRLASDRLFVSITHFQSGRNHTVSSFGSREELIKVLLASSFVPVYGGLKPVEFRGQDVCPAHRGLLDVQLRLANMNIMLSLENVRRLIWALFPPPASTMDFLWEEGFGDAVRFLQREGFTQA